MQESTQNLPSVSILLVSAFAEDKKAFFESCSGRGYTSKRLYDHYDEIFQEDRSGQRYQIALWNLSHEQRLQPVTLAYFTIPHALVFLFYDPCNRESIRIIKERINNIQEHCRSQLSTPSFLLIAHSETLNPSMAQQMIHSEIITCLRTHELPLAGTVVWDRANPQAPQQIITQGFQFLDNRHQLPNSSEVPVIPSLETALLAQRAPACSSTTASFISSFGLSGVVCLVGGILLLCSNPAGQAILMLGAGMVMAFAILAVITGAFKLTGLCDVTPLQHGASPRAR